MQTNRYTDKKSPVCTIIILRDRISFALMELIYKNVLDGSLGKWMYKCKKKDEVEPLQRGPQEFDTKYMTRV